MKKLILAAL